MNSWTVIPFFLSIFRSVSQKRVKSCNKMTYCAALLHNRDDAELLFGL
jgi:hypothetical protein